MADEAGPSGTGTGRLSEEQLAEVEEKFQKGVQAIKDNEINAAVKIFAVVLKSRVKHYGELAPECASAYYRYGSALLYQAQDSADVFGGPLKEQAEADKENGLIAGRPGDDKGDALEEEAAVDEAEEKERERAAVEGGDLQLAWENLETARAIWARDSKKNAEQLSSVHMLLGDVNMENEAFEDALADFAAALEHQTAAEFPPDDRRRAEVHFKRCFAAQFLDRIDEALEAVRTAVDILNRHKSSLADKEWENEKEHEEAVAGVDAILEELNEKVEELETAAKEEEATKAAMRSAMSQLTAAMAAQSGATIAPGESSKDGATGNGAQPARPPGASPVKDLGVVGRGTKRINLAPMAEGPAGTAGGVGASNSAAEPQLKKKKRSLEELMGASGEGDTIIGFGGPSKAEGGTKKEASGPAAAAAPATKPEDAPVPAFLQAYSKKD